MMNIVKTPLSVTNNSSTLSYTKVPDFTESGVRIVTYEQALKDYKKLTELASGGPHDVSIFFENIAEDLLESPCKKTAKRILCDLIERYFNSGDASGNWLDNIEATKIFERHGFIISQEDQDQD